MNKDTFIFVLLLFQPFSILYFFQVEFLRSELLFIFVVHRFKWAMIYSFCISEKIVFFGSDRVLFSRKISWSFVGGNKAWVVSFDSL